MRTAKDTDKSVREAAHLLTTPSAEGIAGVSPIPKQLLSALIEQAFPDTPRGLVYELELNDLQNWFKACAAAEDPGMYKMIAIAAEALCAELYTSEPCKELDLVRALGAYFVRMHAGTIAQNLADQDLPHEREATARRERRDASAAALAAAIENHPDRWTRATIGAAEAIDDGVDDFGVTEWTEQLDAIEEALSSVFGEAP